MRSAPIDEGVARTYSAGHDRVFKAARESVVEAGLSIEEIKKVDDRTWMIIGKKGMSGMSWGELVRVVVQQIGPAETTVRVLSKRKLATNMTAKGDYSASILSNVELILK